MIENEFSRILKTRDIGVGEKKFSYTATQDECVKIALRFKILGVEKVDITGFVQKTSKGFFCLDGRLYAEIVQSDVSTNEPLHQKIDEPIKLILTIHKNHESEDFFDPHDTSPESISLEEDGSVDIGEIFLQYLSLSVDPYPRAS